MSRLPIDNVSAANASASQATTTAIARNAKTKALVQADLLKLGFDQLLTTTRAAAKPTLDKTPSPLRIESRDRRPVDRDDAGPEWIARQQPPAQPSAGVSTRTDATLHSSPADSSETRETTSSEKKRHEGDEETAAIGPEVCPFVCGTPPRLPEATPKDPTATIEDRPAPNVVTADPLSAPAPATPDAGDETSDPIAGLAPSLDGESSSAPTEATFDATPSPTSDDHQERPTRREREAKDVSLIEPSNRPETQSPAKTSTDDAPRAEGAASPVAESSTKTSDTLDRVAPDRTVVEATTLASVTVGSETAPATQLASDSSQNESSGRDDGVASDGVDRAGSRANADSPASGTSPAVANSPSQTPVVAPVAMSAEASGGASSTARLATSASVETVSPAAPTPIDGPRRPVPKLLSHQLAKAETSESTAGRQVDSVKLVQRLLKAIQSSRQSEGDVRLRLHPPELGSLKLEAKVEAGALTARIETETAQAQATILDNLPTLRERLAEQGVRLERFDVDVRGEGGQSAFDQTPGGSDRSDRSPQTPREESARSGKNSAPNDPATNLTDRLGAKLGGSAAARSINVMA